MVRVIFQAKIHNRLDGVLWVEVPKLCLQHCVVEDFKSHPEWKRLIYSRNIDNILEEQVDRLFGQDKRLFLDSIPEDVSVDVFGTLAIVTLHLSRLN